MKNNRPPGFMTKINSVQHQNALCKEYYVYMNTNNRNEHKTGKPTRQKSKFQPVQQTKDLCDRVFHELHKISIFGMRGFTS